MKGIKIALAALATSAALFCGGCGQTQVGYVDVSRVMDEAPQMKNTVEEANKKLLESQQEAENQLAAKTDLTDEEVEKAYADEEKKLMSLNQMYMTQLKQKLDVALGQVSREKKLDAIFENSKQQRTVYLGGIDVTDDVIAKLQ